LFIKRISSEEKKTLLMSVGFDTYEGARNVFDIRFYLVAIVFIVFDLGAVFFILDVSLQVF
jgi:NADH:ubiquinone oxidoreductase subunit 3 (subunit A)